MTFSDLRNSAVYRKHIEPVLNVVGFVFWYLILIVIGWITFDFQANHAVDFSEIKSNIAEIISTIGIMSAILITFIFTKLYAEKSEIISRKIRIARLSEKINSLRKILYILFKKNRFWNNPELLKEYAAYLKLVDPDGAFKMNTREFADKVRKNSSCGEKLIDEMSILWGIDCLTNGIDDDYIIHNHFNRITYNTKMLEEIYLTIELLIDQEKVSQNKDFLKVEDLPDDDKSILAENINAINDTEAVKRLDNKAIFEVFSDYINLFLQEHYILLKLNSRVSRSYFYNLLIDLILFVALIIMGLLILNSTLVFSTALFLSQIIVAVFVASVLDILKNIILVIKFEFKAHGIRGN